MDGEKGMEKKKLMWKRMGRREDEKEDGEIVTKEEEAEETRGRGEDKREEWRRRN